VVADRTWRSVGDRALLRTFPHDEVAAANASALACRARLLELGSVAVEDVVPGARSVLVIMRPGVEPPPQIIEILERDDPDPTTPPAASREHEFAVRYGGDDGPDLTDVARAAALTEEEVVAIHSGAAYVVGFIGFSPGFPYLLGLDPRLATPRLETPRVRVAPGSVGIGGPYTGVYPGATPGGWRLIGRTDVELFDATQDPPSLLAPGDRVRFVAR
jgi:5-oxoprolinase (ATP-hydrolysing) subunit B